ncbi:hypothetical protein AN641_06410 [Candidatus Epulonipiscioides gigas]|nr:hypothetical protein AN641_08980 [Epulopiscium sp. SCG-C07WGA-EpuloA2]ONI44615.1 hypothetical protein AN641_06410 [Epulopiscium sp. SCG-C07WGA-EpuloA2]
MSMPSIPNLEPSIKINQEEALNVILTSIAMQELSLSHIVNAEGEKIQFALGTLHEGDQALSFDEILKVNQSANRMLRDVIKNQMLLSMKMEDTASLLIQLQSSASAPKVEPEPTPEPTPEPEPNPEPAV